MASRTTRLRKPTRFGHDRIRKPLPRSTASPYSRLRAILGAPWRPRHPDLLSIGTQKRPLRSRPCSTALLIGGHGPFRKLQAGFGAGDSARPRGSSNVASTAAPKTHGHRNLIWTLYASAAFSFRSPLL